MTAAKFHRTALGAAAAVAAVIALGPADGVRAATITLPIDTTINGATPPDATPWAQAEITDTGVNSVRLTMSNLLPAATFVEEWLFNVDDTLDATTFTFTFVSGNEADSLLTSATKSLDGGTNVKGGWFNINFSWPVSNADPDRFSGGETSVYDITGAGLTAASFLSLSADDTVPPTSTGGWNSAARFQGIQPGEGSGSAAGVSDDVPPPPLLLPEPGALALLGLGLAGFGLLRRRPR